MSGITLANAMLENVNNVSHLLGGLIECYLQQMQSVTTPELNLMLLQGILMCCWYDASESMAKLEQFNALDHFLTQSLSQIDKLKTDIQVKRFMMGLTSLLAPV